MEDGRDNNATILCKCYTMYTAINSNSRQRQIYT